MTVAVSALQARAGLCSSAMPPDEGGGCLGSAQPSQAGSLGHLGARLSLRMLRFWLLSTLWQAARYGSRQ